MRPILLVFWMFFCCGIAHADVPTEKAVLAIIGEAENQGYSGMLAVAEAIRNKGNLRQVFGATSKRVLYRRYSQATYNMALLAWQNSKHTNTVGKADVWGNKSDIIKFSRQKWFKKYKLVKRIKDHYFYMEV